MRFLFVSHIDKIVDNKIQGHVNFSSQEPWRRKDHNNNTLISTSVVSEAVGQLVSWMALRDNQFSGRPVFLFANRIDLNGKPIFPSENLTSNIKVDLEAWITNRDNDSFVFSGVARFNGEEIVSIIDCGGYMMPLGQLEDPEATKQRFSSLMSTTLEANPASEAFCFSSLVDNIVEIDASKSITTAKTMRFDEPFYPDHFPRFPVTPIVVINEMIGEATKKLVALSETNPTHRDRVELTPIAVRDLKIKSFIRPGDTALTTVKIVETFQNEIETIAEICVNQKRILRGRYRYRLEHAPSAI